MKKNNQTGSVLVKVLVIAVMVAGVFAGYLLLRNRTYVLSSALTPKSVGSVDVSKSEVTNGLVPVDLLFRTGSGDTNVEAVSTITLRLKVTSKSKAVLAITDQDGNLVTALTPSANLSESNDWKFPVNTITSESQEQITEFAAVNTSLLGYSSFNSERLATFYVRGADSTDDLNLEFDNNSSFMFSKRRPVTNIWVNQ